VKVIQADIKRENFWDNYAKFVHMVELVLVIEGISWQTTLHGKDMVYHENIGVTCFIFTKSSI
jgi:hypothetical protein